MSWALLAFVFVVSLKASLGQVILEPTFEFENTNNGDWMWRGAASGLKTLRIVDEYGLTEVSLKLCLKPLVKNQDVLVTIDNITYTNDGPKDEVKVSLDDVSIANWTTIERCGSGFEWNKPKNSGPLGGTLNLPEGNHTLIITAKTDEYGVELDKIDMTFENQNPAYDVFCDHYVNTPQ